MKTTYDMRLMQLISKLETSLFRIVSNIFLYLEQLNRVNMAHEYDGWTEDGRTNTTALIA